MDMNLEQMADPMSADGHQGFGQSSSIGFGESDRGILDFTQPSSYDPQVPMMPVSFSDTKQGNISTLCEKNLF